MVQFWQMPPVLQIVCLNSLISFWMDRKSIWIHAAYVIESKLNIPVHLVHYVFNLYFVSK